MTGIFENNLKQNLEDPEYAKYFGAAQAKSSLALTLTKARKTLGITQEELANLAGVSQSYIAKLEGGEANPTLERVGSLLATLGLSLTTDTKTLSPYPETPTFEIYWPSDSWLLPPPVEYLQFTNEIAQGDKVLIL